MRTIEHSSVGMPAGIVILLINVHLVFRVLVEQLCVNAGTSGNQLLLTHSADKPDTPEPMIATRMMWWVKDKRTIWKSMLKLRPRRDVLRRSQSHDRVRIQCDHVTNHRARARST